VQSSGASFSLVYTILPYRFMSLRSA